MAPQANKHQASQLPKTGFLRLAQIVGNLRAIPPIPPIVPVCRSSIWYMVKNGQFPKPVKLGPRTTAWRVEDVRDWIESKSQKAA
ncbi:MAG: helix-turn-helix transcriptional regulator [Candidatus Methylumidiphilus sp.]